MCCFSLLVHLQANGQVEAANKIIKHHLKMKLGNFKGLWADELSSVLWAYMTTSQSHHGQDTLLLGL